MAAPAAPIPPTEYRVPIEGPDLDKVTLHAESEQDQKLHTLRG